MSHSLDAPTPAEITPAASDTPDNILQTGLEAVVLVRLDKWALQHLLAAEQVLELGTQIVAEMNTYGQTIRHRGCLVCEDEPT